MKFLVSKGIKLSLSRDEIGSKSEESLRNCSIDKKLPQRSGDFSIHSFGRSTEWIYENLVESWVSMVQFGPYLQAWSPEWWVVLRGGRILKRWVLTGGCLEGRVVGHWIFFLCCFLAVR